MQTRLPSPLFLELSLSTHWSHLEDWVFPADPLEQLQEGWIFDRAPFLPVINHLKCQTVDLFLQAMRQAVVSWPHGKQTPCKLSPKQKCFSPKSFFRPGAWSPFCLWPLLENYPPRQLPYPSDPDIVLSANSLCTGYAMPSNKKQYHLDHEAGKQASFLSFFLN